MPMPKTHPQPVETPVNQTLPPGQPPVNVTRTTSGMNLRQRNRKPAFPPPGSLFLKKQQKKHLMLLNNLSFDAMVIKIQKQLPINVITPNQTSFSVFKKL